MSALCALLLAAASLLLSLSSNASAQGISPVGKTYRVNNPTYPAVVEYHYFSFDGIERIKIPGCCSYDWMWYYDAQNNVLYHKKLISSVWIPVPQFNAFGVTPLATGVVMIYQY